MERKPSVLDAQRAHDLGAGCGGQNDGEWLSAHLRTRRRQARDGGSRQLGERRFPLAEVVGEKSGLALGVALDHAAGGTDHYYRATSAADLADALMAISKVVSSCTFTMSQSPPDPDNIAVYLDGKLMAKDSDNGWSFGASPLTAMLSGASCTSITSGGASKVQVLFGGPGEQPPPQILF